MSDNFEKLGMGIDVSEDEYDTEVIENINNLNEIVNIMADNYKLNKKNSLEEFNNYYKVENSLEY